MKKFLTILLTGLILGSLSFPAITSAETPFKIGIIDTYSGPPSVYCNDVRDGFKFALDEINSKGGVLGKKLEFVTRDDKFKVDLALSAAKELLMREKVDILAGTTNSGVSLAVSDLAKREKVPFVVTFGKSAAITGARGNRYVFSMNENTGMIGRAAAIALAKRPYVKYWIAGDDYEYGHSVAKETWTELKKVKPEVELIGESWWKVGEPDFGPYISAIMAAKPDAVIIAAGGASCVPFLKAAKATGFNEQIPFIAHNAIELSTLRPLGISAPEGILGTSPYLFYYPEIPANKAFADKYKQVFDKYPSAGSFCGYASGLFIAKALEKAGSADREKFIDALAGLTVETPVGKLTVREFDHQLMLPMFVGVTKTSPDYDFLIAGEINIIPGDQVITPLDEVKKARGQ